ncbi:GntR family transcriptional regulator [Flavobacterium sp. LB1P62]|uniref:GntR family transcriptional regulator n=1 Tax=unclassified Flavobacterium TaxID=196869 RepID=UPI003AAAF932
METFKYIEIDETSRMPKYKQIVDSVIYNVSIGRLSMDQKIPSINMLSEGFNLSRDTVEKAYNILKERNVISPIMGKGYYVTRTKLISKINILFLINKLSSYKMSVFNSFIDNIGGNSQVDLHVYHFDETLFLNLLDKNKFAYDKYVIMPHFKTKDLKHVSLTDKALKLIKEIPKEKLIILDEKNPLIEDGIVEIYQDFENDIYNALKEGLPKIAKYDKLILIYPEKAVYPYPRRILNGFKKFCIEYNICFEILDEICDDMVLIKGDLFIVIEESDLVSLIKQIRDYEFRLGKDIGVISYNDTALKELLGITVISTDFKMMGETAARMILNKEIGKVKNPFNFIDRDSI